MKGKIFSENPVLFEMPRLCSMDIDNEDDWFLTELITPYFKKQFVLKRKGK